ncbi:MAG: four helix bundle protein [Candidatus Portnoybacteria bacterium]|nr:four helix bundle protein [Candidatus Portnoybacteria bacterium]
MPNQAQNPIIPNQKSKVKMQNDKEKFKKDFIKRLIRFSIEIIKFTEELKKNRIPWAIIDQLIRSATSVGANVVEAKSSSSKRDYIRFFEIALKSANETKYWLILVREIYHSYNKKAQELLNEVEEISKIIASSILTLKGKK